MAALENVLNEHAKPLHQAIDDQTGAGYPKAKLDAPSGAVHARAPTTNQPGLSRHVPERNGGEFEKKRQKTMNQKRWRKCQEAISALSSATSPLVVPQLIFMLTAGPGRRAARSINAICRGVH